MSSLFELLYSIAILMVFECPCVAPAPVDSKDTVAGSNFTLVCPADPKEGQVIDWGYNSPYSRRGAEVTILGKVINGFRTQFTTGTTRRGQKTLIISSVQLRNAGLYHCVDNNGLGQTYYILLSVLTDVDSYLTTQTAAELVPLTDRPTTDYNTLNQDQEHTFNPYVASTIVLAVGLAIVLAVLAVSLTGCFLRRNRRKRHKLTSQALNCCRKKTTAGTVSAEYASNASAANVESTENNDLSDNYFSKNFDDVRQLIVVKVALEKYRAKMARVENPYHLASDYIRSTCAMFSIRLLSKKFRKVYKKSVKEPFKPYRPMPRFVKSLNEAGGKDVWTATKLNDHVYVVRKKSIEEYNLQFQLNRIIQIIDFDLSVLYGGFVANKHDGHMYLGDRYRGWVWQIDVHVSKLVMDEKTRMGLKQWYTAAENENIQNVCVNKAGNVCVLIAYDFSGRAFWKGKIIICNKAGTSTKQVTVPENILQPNGIACIDDNTFAVMFKNDNHGGIVKIDNIGKQIGRMYPVTGRQRCHFDRHSKRIFQIDSQRNKVLLLDENFHLLQTILSFEQNSSYTDLDKRPSRGFYSNSIKSLFILMCSGRLAVYKF